MKDKKFTKRKQREKEVKRKILSKRSQTRLDARIERETQRERHKLRERIEPYVGDENLDGMEEQQKRKEIARIERAINSDIQEAKMQVIKAKDKGVSENVVNHLEKNYQILISLREEFLEEQNSRSQINEELEEQGLSTLRGKMEHLSKQAIKTQKETAIVEVIKAEDNLS